MEFQRGLREWQAVQIDRNQIKVRLEPLPDVDLNVDEVRARIEERLDSVGLRQHLDVRYEIAPRLDWDWRTGKFRRLVSEVGPPHDLPADRPSGAVVRAGRESTADLSPSIIPEAASHL